MTAARLEARLNNYLLDRLRPKNRVIAIEIVASYSHRIGYQYHDNDDNNDDNQDR